jgi:hypothetical protein
MKGALEVLVMRIVSEQARVNEGFKERQLWINKSWNIIRSLPEIEDYIPVFIPIIEESISPLYAMLKDPTLIEFDEDVFLMVSALVDKSHTVTL